jgi:DNA-binding HxlR family transcriptional regulator
MPEESQPARFSDSMFERSPQANSNVLSTPVVSTLRWVICIAHVSVPYHLLNASEKCYCPSMPKKKPSPKRRSGCPLNASVETLGDRWSLLIIRDMMLRGFRTYKEFLESFEGIATNILADRLRKLQAYGIITTERDPSDGRRLFYLLTEKGIDLAPVLTEMVLWAARHEDTDNQALVRQMKKDKEQLLAEVRQRWAEKTILSTVK